MKIVIVLSTFLLVGSLGAAEVYRWVDSDGVVHYSDVPHDDAETIDLPDAQTFSAPAVQRKPPVEDDSDGEDGAIYSQLVITSPSDGQTGWNIPGDVDVTLNLVPRLNRAHSVSLYLDGEQVGSASSSDDLSFKLTDVLRGTHSLRAVVLDGAGNNLIESAPVTFTVLKTSVLNPNNPNNLPPLPAPGGPITVPGGAG